MDYLKIRKSIMFMIIGHIFLIISKFSILSKIESLTYANVLVFAMIPGFILLTLGAGLIRKEHAFFKASFIIFLSIDALFIIYFINGMIPRFVKFDDNINYILYIVSVVINALFQAAIAMSNCMYANALKEVFKKIKNKNMSFYSWLMGFTVNKLVILAIAIPTIKTTKISAVLIVSFSIIISFLIDVSMIVYFIICYRNLNIKDENKKSAEI